MFFIRFNVFPGEYPIFLEKRVKALASMSKQHRNKLGEFMADGDSAELFGVSTMGFSGRSNLLWRYKGKGKVDFVGG